MYILEECGDIRQLCYNAKPFLQVVKTLISIIQFSVPILLVILGTVDMVKAVTKANDEKAIKDATQSLIKRLIYGVVIFLVPFLVRLVLRFVDVNILQNSGESTSWIGCWTNLNDDSYFNSCENIYKYESRSGGNDSNTGTNNR